MIRLLHVVDSLGNGGLETGLVNVVAGLDETRFEHVVVAVRKLGPMADRLPQNRVVLENLNKGRGCSQVFALARMIRRHKPDIVHSRNWGSIEAVLAARWERVPAIVHSEHGFESGAEVAEPLRRTLLRRVAYEAADRVFAVSREVGDVHARRTGFQRGRISVIHNGVDTRRFFADSGARLRMRQELELSADDFCIGAVGNLLPVKDHLTMLRAAEIVAAKCSGARFVLAGEGTERKKLESFVSARRELAETVRFLGTTARVPQLLNAMDAFVLPSVNEGISNSLLEAMASGVPVLATSTGGNPEVVSDGQSGLLFPVGGHSKLAESLLMIQRDADLRRRLATAGTARVLESFSVESMIGKYELLYESLVPVGKEMVGLAESA